MRSARGEPFDAATVQTKRTKTMRQNSSSRRDFLKTSALALTCAATQALETNNVAHSEELTAKDAPRFLEAVPVWAKGRAEEMNVTLVFTARFTLTKDADVSSFILRATGSSIMRVEVNGIFAGYGPARGPKGWYRVDEWRVGKYLFPQPHWRSDDQSEFTNVIELTVSGYNSVSYYLLSQPAFLQAELVDGDGRVYASTRCETKENSFVCRDLTGARIQKVQRHGWHRTFIEAYDWTRELDESPVELERRPDVPLLPRRSPYPEFKRIDVGYGGWLKTGKTVEREDFKPWRGNALTGINEKFTGYKLDELELILTDELGRLKTVFDKNREPLEIFSTYKEGDVQIVDFGVNYTGFWNIGVETKEDAEFAITFDEVLTKEGDVNFMRCSTCNAVKWRVPGDRLGKKHFFSTFEPQCARYVKIYALKGSFKLLNLSMTEYAHPEIGSSTLLSDAENLNRVLKAAVQTFRANAVDVFTDCPHRERAGWMCDSFFTARAAFDLTGTTDVEDAVFENYALPESFPNLPKGATPMCYPSDTWHGQFIPNWMMWLVLELKEYRDRQGKAEIIEALRPRVEGIFEFFEKYENSDGLLEKLPNRVFVEWSDANKFLQDVNYPTNMLYAAALEAGATLYDVPQWRDKAERVRETVRNQSYNGEFFVDHAVRNKDGGLDVLDDISEVCQYFAFFFRTASPESHPELWRKLLDEFGPNREKEGKYPNVKKANAFVGNMIRFELLSQARRARQIVSEVVSYYDYMAERTGTLWENVGAGASCNHGFASHVAHIVYRDLLGVTNVDLAAKKINVRIPNVDSPGAMLAHLPIPNAEIMLLWAKFDDKIKYKIGASEGYQIDVQSELELEELNEEEMTKLILNFTFTINEWEMTR